MEVVGQFFTSLFAQVWRVLELNMPVFNIPIWSVWVGVFLIETSIRVFREFFNYDSSQVHLQNRVEKRYSRKGDHFEID